MRRDDSSLALSLDLPLARATSSRVCRLRLHGLIVASRRRVELLRRGPHKRCQTSSFGPRLCGPLVGVFRPNADGRRNAGRTCCGRNRKSLDGGRSGNVRAPGIVNRSLPRGRWRACPVQPRPAGFRARGAARRGGARPFHDSQLRFDQIAKKNSNQGHRKTYNSLTRCLECQRPTAEATHVDPPPRDEYKARLAAAWAC